MSDTVAFFRAGGTMDPNAPSYIERQADADLLKALLAREYVFLLDSRQKGKSSMVARTIVRLKEAGVVTVKLDLQRFGANVTPEQWYGGLLSTIGQEFGLTKELFDYWSQNQLVGPLARWISSLEHVLLRGVESSIVIFIDEVDFVRALPFPTDEFFAGIRDCYNRRAEGKGFERLTFCIVGVATPGQLIRNPEITPFNIGKRIDISDFTIGEATHFARVLNRGGRDGAKLIGRVHYWLSGHPYLTQLLCSHLVGDASVRGPRDVDRKVRRLFLSPEARRKEPHFSDVERRLLDPDIPGVSEEEQRIQSLELYGRVLKGRRVEFASDNPVVATLRLSGVGLEDMKTLRVRNRLYRIVFDERWRRSSLPDAELRRQRGAARIAMLRTVAVAGVVVAAVSAGAFQLLTLSNDRQRALSRLGTQSKELQRTSDERQAALTTLRTQNQTLEEVSSERASALTSLRSQNDALRRITQQREQALADLRKRSAELAYSTYLGWMNAAYSDLGQSRVKRLSDAVQATKDNPNKGWEWGNLALGVSFGIREERVTKGSVLEEQEGGGLCVVSRNSVFSLANNPAKLIQDLPEPQFNVPLFRRGAFRVKAVENPRGSEIDDAATGQTLIPARSFSMIYDVDPKRRLYLLAQGATLDTIQLRTIDGDRLVKGYSGPSDSNCAQFLPDGTILGAFSTEKDGVGEVHRWDRQGTKISQAATDQQYAKGISVSNDGRYYAVWGENKKVEVREVASHKAVFTLPDQSKQTSALKFSKGGSRVLVGSEDGGMRLYDIASGRRLCDLLGFRASVASIAFAFGEKGVAGLDSSGVLRVWPTVPRPWIDPVQVPGFRAIFGSFGGDGETLILHSDDNEAISWNVRTRAYVRRRFDDPKAQNVASAFDGISALFVGRADGRLERFDGKTLRKVASRPVFRSKITRIDRVPRENLIFASSQSKQFAMLDATTLEVLYRIEPKLIRKGVDSAGVQIDDCTTFDQEKPQMALYVGEVGRIQIYAVNTGKLIHEWDPIRPVRAMAFASQGRELVVSLGTAWYVQDGETWIYDPITGQQTFQFHHPGQTVGMISYAPQTGILAAGTRDLNKSDRVIFLYDMRSRKTLAEVSPEPYYQTFQFSPDGERLLTWTFDNVDQLWDPRTGEEMCRLTMRGMPRFSDDGRRILQSGGGMIRVWSTVNWKASPRALQTKSVRKLAPETATSLRAIAR